MEKDFLKIKTKATLHDTVKVDEEKMISEINKIMKLIGINKLKLDDHIQEIDRIERYLEKYVPIRVQRQIVQTINAVGTGPMLAQMQQYEFDTFNELNEALINDDSENILNDD